MSSNPYRAAVAIAEFGEALANSRLYMREEDRVSTRNNAEQVRAKFRQWERNHPGGA